MADDRVNVLVNGMSVASACSNHMNPARPTSSRRMLAGQRHGGHHSCEQRRRQHRRHHRRRVGCAGICQRQGDGTSRQRIDRSIAATALSMVVTPRVSAATENSESVTPVRMSPPTTTKTAAAQWSNRPSTNRQNHALQLAGRRGNHLVTVDLGYQHIPQQGFVNARMDMTEQPGEVRQCPLSAGSSAGEARRPRLLREHQARDEYPEGQDSRHEHAHGYGGTNLGYSVDAEIPLSPRDTLRVGNEFAGSARRLVAAGDRRWSAAWGLTTCETSMAAGAIASERTSAIRPACGEPLVLLEFDFGKPFYVFHAVNAGDDQS